LAHERKGLIIVCDGMGGRPVPALNGLTTLEAARTPNMDRFAEGGMCGIMHPIAPGVRAGSDTAHLSILGFDPYKYYTGRGPFEAAGIGMDVRAGDVAFRCNFSTVDENMIVVDRRAGRIKEGTEELAAALDGLEFEGVKCIVAPSVEHRGALVLRGEGLSADITDADPHDPGVKVHTVEALKPEAEKTARVVNAFVRKSYEILSALPLNAKRKQAGELPANIMLPRGAGVAPHLGKFDDKYGLRSAMIVEVALIKGLGRYLQMDVIDVPGATGGQDTDEAALARATIDALATHDFVLTNIKCPDLGGHDARPDAKIAAIEKADDMVGILLDGLDWNITIAALTADHCTPIDRMDHTGDSVPIAFRGPGVRVDDVKQFGERAVAAGCLGPIRAMDIMNIITNQMNIQEKFGA
jgi:2,3-bisphosphoglycerate-independent phosphoglycerate mutase